MATELPPPHMKDIDVWLDEQMAKRKREEEIRCPSCDHVISDEPEDMQQHISYWGSHDDGPREHECPNPNCEVTFYIYELVRRTYKVASTWETANEWWKGD